MKQTPTMPATFLLLTSVLVNFLTGCTIYANSDRETFNTRAVVQNPHGAASVSSSAASSETPSEAPSKSSCALRIGPQTVAVRCRTLSITKDQTIVRVSR